MQEIIDAALRRQRTAVLIALAVGLGTGLLALWLEAVGGLVGLLPALWLLAFAALILREVFRGPNSGEPQVDPAARAFFSPPRAAPPLFTLLGGMFAYMGVDSVHRLDGGLPRSLLTALYGAVCVMTVLAAWWRVSFVALTPEGVCVGAPRPLAVVPWEALDPHALSHKSAGGFLRLAVTRPELVRRAGWGPGRPVLVPFRDLTVAPALLADVIRYYVAHPEHWSAIGSPEEYARLRQALTAGR